MDEPFHIEESERQKKAIVESIEYASIIQSALLPPSHQIKKILKDHFILYLPRDIVSGDFYWIATKGEWIYLAAADCTGHGVPGSLMSILGISFLNEIISQKGIFRANRILNLLREKIMKALHQTGDRNESKDGMDISLCLINTKTLEFRFSGANNPLYYIRNHRIYEMKGDRMPIGISGMEEKSFTEFMIRLKKGDLLYLFSDGYPDQFGGPRDKKLKYGPFQDLLLSVHNEPLNVQKELLINALLEWKGENDQVDDIMVIGIRI